MDVGVPGVHPGTRPYGWPCSNPTNSGGWNVLPSGKHTKNYGKSPFLIGKSTINGQFSIAMLVYQRVKPPIKNRTGQCWAQQRRSIQNCFLVSALLSTVLELKSELAKLGSAHLQYWSYQPCWPKWLVLVCNVPCSSDIFLLRTTLGNLNWRCKFSEVEVSSTFCLLLVKMIRSHPKNYTNSNIHEFTLPKSVKHNVT